MWTFFSSLFLVFLHFKFLTFGHAPLQHLTQQLQNNLYAHTTMPNRKERHVLELISYVCGFLQVSGFVVCGIFSFGLFKMFRIYAIFGTHNKFCLEILCPHKPIPPAQFIFNFLVVYERRIWEKEEKQIVSTNTQNKPLNPNIVLHTRSI